MNVLERGFNTFSKCAYRLEILPQYSIYDTNEFCEYEKYIKGEVIEGFANQEWLDSITQWKNDGKIIERIRVIPQILTDYFKYEFFWCYPRNIEHGEKITFITYDNYMSICGGKIVNDFWAFDNDIVVFLLYNEKYEYINCMQLSQKEVDFYLSIFKKMRLLAIDYEKCKNSIIWKHQI